MNTEEILEHHDWVVPFLEEAGIRAKFYKRPPLRKEVFSLSMDPSNVIRIWPGEHADIEITYDSGLKQAVITAYEPRRELIESATKIAPLANGIGPFDSSYRLPEETKSVITNPKFTKLEKPTEYEKAYAFGIHKAEIHHTIPKTTQSFLVGMDETSQFVSALPKPCSSVEQAHKVLRPAGLTKRAVRQGEWFFDPVSALKAKSLWDSVATFNGYHSYNVEVPNELEDYSSHVAAITVRNRNETFAIGVVRDTRRGRHKPLYLDTWHRVVRNNELITSATTRFWD